MWLPEAANPAKRKCAIAAGATIGIQWHHNSNSPSDDILEATHKGPCLAYLAKSDTGAGPVWFKIFEDGYDPATQLWGTDRLIRNRGRIDVTIPSDIAPGNYLLRGEVLALHNAYSLDGVQPYVGCVELVISGSGSATPQGVSFPGAYKRDSPSMLFNVYQSFNSYTIPGPELYRPSSATTPPTPRPTTKPTTIPTTLPTPKPTPRPTPTPTPSSTIRPTTTPTTPPPTNQETVKVRLNQGSNRYWFAVEVDAGRTVVKVEFKDNQASWVALLEETYGFVYDKYQPIDLPLTLQVTLSNYKQVQLVNIITSWENKGYWIDSRVAFSN